MNKGTRFPFLFLASGFYSGLSPFMPGTAGTVVGIGLYWCLSHLPFFQYLITCIAFIFLAVWLADRAAAILQQADPSLIVIDEIAGYLVTMIGIPGSWHYIVMGFILFRTIDVLKPFPIQVIDRDLKGGWGIVLDDVVAGIFANLIMQVVIRWM